MQKPQRSTLLTKEAARAQREWVVVDLEGQTLGRAATQIAAVLRGKHKPTYTPHVDTGDFVVVVNAEKLVLKGGKLQKKMYRWHTGYLGGLKEIAADKLIQKDPERMVREAVWGMLPKNRLGRQMFKKLKVYRGPEHKHAAQQPRTLSVAAVAAAQE